MTTRLLQGDALAVLRTLPADSFDCCVTSPPYWGLRDYGVEGQIGLEATPEEYVTHLVDVFDEVRRVLRADGTLWLNLGDSYCSDAGATVRGEHCGKNTAAAELRQPNRRASFRRDRAPRMDVPHKAAPLLKPKDLVGAPWRVAFALQAAGWWLRSDIVWAKPNPMPESVTDRPTKAHEYVFLLARSERYYFDQDAAREPYLYGRDHPRLAPAPSPSPMPGAAPHTGLHQGVVAHPVAGWAKGPGSHAAIDHQRATGARRGKLLPADAEPKVLTAAGRNVRSVWSICTEPYAEAHFATFPTDLARRCIVAGSRPGGGCFGSVRRCRHDGARGEPARALVRRDRAESGLRRDGALPHPRRCAALRGGG